MSEHGDNVEPIVKDDNKPEPSTHGAPKMPDPEPNKKPESKQDDTAAKEAEAKAAADAEAKEKADKEVQAKIEAAKEEERKNWQDSYVELDNPAGKSVVNMLKEAGVTPIEANAIFEKAITTGDLNNVDWATLEKKLGSDKAYLAKVGIKQYHDEVYAVQRETTAKVYEALGGEKNWQTVRDWAQKKEASDPGYAKQVAEYRKMIEAGGLSAITAANALKADYTKAPETKGLDNSQIVHGDSRPEVQEGPLGKAEYLTLIRKANADNASEKEIEILRARRKAGMKAGI